MALFGLQTVSAQMTDDQIVEYVKNGMSHGKGERQIGQELLRLGVTSVQMERLKNRYDENQSSNLRMADPGMALQRQERYREVSAEMDSGQPDVLEMVVIDPGQEAADSTESRIFGHGVFNSRLLSFEPSEGTATPADYRLGPGDEVIIDIWGANEDHVRQYISPDGDIMVSQIGPVYLNGLTVSQAEEKVRRIFSGKYADMEGDNPSSDVRLSLGQVRSIQINIMGEVATPGTYRLSGFSTLFHALYRAGGVTPIGSLRTVRVMRNGREVAVADIYEYLFDGNLSTDIRLQEGDVIIVPPYRALVSIEGNVKRPMKYEMKENEHLSDLIAYAGGFTGDAYTGEVRLVRETGLERQLLTIPGERFSLCRIEDGDAVTVDSTLDRFSNRIEVRGAVFRPGKFELGKDIATVRQLIERAGGLTEDAFGTRAQLLRETDDLSLEMLALDLTGILNGSRPDVVLRKNDVLTIQSIHEIEERGDFSISGQVARPGNYPFAEHTSVEDLILQAGGLLDGASLVRVDVSRRMKDPHSLLPGEEISKIYSYSIKDGFVVDGDPGFILQPYDMVEIRRSPGYEPQRRVMVEGEVLFPGGYTLVRKNERLSSLVARSGGLTDEAYLRGARLVRVMNDEERALRNDILRMVQNNGNTPDSLVLNKITDSGDTYMVGIELDKALAEPGSDYDMVLREGDRLVIPEQVSTVHVGGQVLYPNTVLYVKNKKLSYYINQAGGYALRAKRRKAYVIYLNGTVSKARPASRTCIEPGCQIIVPTRRERRGLSIGEVVGLTTSVASLGTMAASIAHLAK